MKSIFCILALLAVFLALPEASGCGQVRQQVIVQQPVVVQQQAFAVPVQQFVVQPVTALSVVAVPVIQPQAVVVQPVVQQVIVRQRRGPFLSLQIGR